MENSLATFILKIIIPILIVLYLFYKFTTRNHDYWKKRMVPYIKPLPIVGNFLDIFLMRRTIGHLFADFYKQLKTPYFGIYIMNTPYLFIRSPELIKSILVKDFNHFHDRVTVSDEKCDSVVSKILFFVKNPEWKAMRSKMTPAFSSGKIKNMVPLIEKASLDMIKFLEKNCSNRILEAKEICAKYGTDVVASCAFGIDAGCFEDENAIFRIIGKKMFQFEWKNALRQLCYFIAPDLVKYFRIPFFDSSATNFMRDMVWKTINQRENSQTKRNDVIDILIELRKQNTSNDLITFEGDTVVAQAGQFYAAGFETTSTTLSYALYELALNPEMQRKAREEIKGVLENHGSFTYEAMQDMKYLNTIICETLRMYPVLPFLDRCCMEDYKLPNSDLTIEKGTRVFIPMCGLHYDPEYFPDPEKFMPDRFSEENKAKITPFSYIPFGVGPRNCIGERFGMLVNKIGLAHLLLNFEIEKNSETPYPIVYETMSFLLVSTVGLPMTFKKI